MGKRQGEGGGAVTLHSPETVREEQQDLLMVPLGQDSQARSKPMAAQGSQVLPPGKEARRRGTV